jgi:hypothetical protein
MHDAATGSALWAYHRLLGSYYLVTSGLPTIRPERAFKSLSAQSFSQLRTTRVSLVARQCANHGWCKLLPVLRANVGPTFPGVIIVYHLRIDQRCNLVPQVGVVLDLMMGLIERTYKPGIVVAIDGRTTIGHLEIADDRCSSRVRGDNLRAPLQRTLRLVEVNRADHVSRDHGWLLPGFGNDVQLDCKLHGNAASTQFAGKFSSLGRSPAVAIDDDSRTAFFFV